MTSVLITPDGKTVESEAAHSALLPVLFCCRSSAGAVPEAAHALPRALRSSDNEGI